MSKLILRPACYEGVADVTVREIKYTERHKELVDEANKKIEESRVHYATAYKNAGSYLGN